MNVLMLGNNLESWTYTAALASTGCVIHMDSKELPDADSELMEPDLYRLLLKQREAGRLVFGSDKIEVDLLIDARQQTDEQRLELDLLDFAARLEALPAEHQIVVALVQPVPVGTTERLQNKLQQQGFKQLLMVYWPGFVQAGRALESFTRSQRIILGSNQPTATSLIRRLMSPFNRSRDALLVMPPKEAELTKIAINGMLATRVSFMNELSELASQRGIDIETVRQGIGSDSRIGYQYLYPGCGFGGEAFLQTLDQLGAELNHQAGFGLLDSVQAINDQQKDLLFQKFWRFYRADVAGKAVALWGCAFKPNTASISGSPALVLIEALLAHGVQVRVYDPMALPTLQKLLGEKNGLIYADSPEAAAQDADAVLLVTEWKEFWNLNMQTIHASMKTPLLLDGRNIYDPQELQRQSWIYSGVGRGQAI
ncbi:MAG: UDP-glucose/GDP-mannose dehydrogenase family protein [Marinospirillum sp.]|uniref:nucleotide sugar dehydrogenase n=1 Tax=Marinospirillum sp. TaxID=2183934 RepID=UPI001A0326AA|nr:nucleotide sugar dehydrogenase [Marinospirillum sp.]MBE0505957.1 UDP-glucose/GDP-mannose dehydrogenase family protein [Marinospirillum sp.]